MQQEIHPLLSLGDDGADVHLPPEVMGDDGVQQSQGLHNVQ